MNLIIKIIIIFLISTTLNARKVGETEITTEDGIEVFQNEKYYLLKQNVKIVSDNFTLNADEVKINFDKSLYDITELDANGNVDFKSDEFKTSGSGSYLNFKVKVEKIKVKGEGSQLVTSDVRMFSDGFIEVNNLNGDFFLKGTNSKLVNENIIIKADTINGNFSEKANEKEITYLEVIDKNISYVKNNDTEMYAKKINFDYDTSIIELIDDVIIIRDEEKITGDYGTLDTKNNSYKIKSNNQNKVKAVIQNNE
jgi:lipopolysaccharide export system protein LptA